MAGPGWTAAHRRRLREMWRSAGWPCHDPIELDLLASGLLLALAGFMAYNTLSSLPPNGSAQYQAGLALPVVALVFQWLAGRSIRKDEKLVRSMDRLR